MTDTLYRPTLFQRKPKQEPELVTQESLSPLQEQVQQETTRLAAFSRQTLLQNQVTQEAERLAAFCRQTSRRLSS